MRLPFRPYEGQEPYIFADFSHKDSETVLPLLDAMKQRGYRIWYNSGIPSSSNWRNEIALHIHP